MSGLLEFLRNRVLCDDLRARRPEAVDALFERLAGPLYHYALSITRRQADAEEVLQEVFMQLVRDPERLGAIGDLKAYLYRSIRNRALNQERRRDREAPLDPSIFEIPAQPEKDTMELEQALAALPDEQREVVVLKTWQGLTFREIADLLAVSPNTAASRYRYALEHMKKSMAGEVYA